MAASDSELEAVQAQAPPRANGSAEPYIAHEPESQQPLPLSLPLSQITLPSTEPPGSPIEPASSFKTEILDDRPTVTVIPSSLTPPPSTQVALPNDGDGEGDANGNMNTGGGGGGAGGRVFPPSSQRSVLFSPPATILNTTTTMMRDRDREAASAASSSSSDYVPPAPRQVVDASAEELRALLQTCVAEHQKLKMEAAHHKLQFNLLSLQADEEAKRAAVEHDMVRRQVDALRMAEHTRQARRELSGPSESLQSKYLQVKGWWEAAMEENETLRRRVKVAKKVIQQKEEQTIGLVEERDVLLTRIRENREHFHMLCGPGGIFHGALTPRQMQMNLTPQQIRATPRGLRREESGNTSSHNTREHGLSALLEAMNQSQDHANTNSNHSTHSHNVNINGSTSGNNNNNNNNSNNNKSHSDNKYHSSSHHNSVNISAPTTPMGLARPAPRTMGRHHRNAQSMSALPRTPMNRPTRDQGGLLPSVDLVAQTEPRIRSSQRRYGMGPSTPPLRARDSQRKSRESTISAEDNEELARQAVESVKAVQSLAADAMRQLAAESRRQGQHQHQHQEQEQEQGQEQASQQEADADTEDGYASRAAIEMLRRLAHDRDETVSGERDEGPGQGPAEVSAAMQAKLFPGELGGRGGEKRKFSGEGAAAGQDREREREREREPEHGASAGGSYKKGRPADSPRVGLGIQYRR